MSEISRNNVGNEIESAKGRIACMMLCCLVYAIHDITKCQMCVGEKSRCAQGTVCDFFAVNSIFGIM